MALCKTRKDYNKLKAEADRVTSLMDTPTYWPELDKFKPKLEEFIVHAPLQELRTAELLQVIAWCSSWRPMQPFAILMHIASHHKTLTNGK